MRLTHNGDSLFLCQVKTGQMIRLSIICQLLALCHLVNGQEARFFVEASRDTLLEGHLVQLTYHIENAELNEFTPPEFTGFDLVAGPQQSSSTRIMNGRVSRQASITYILASTRTGEFTLEPARLVSGDMTLECQRKSLVVLPNPGERPDPQFPGYRPRTKPSAPSADPRLNLLGKGKKVYKM